MSNCAPVTPPYKASICRDITQIEELLGQLLKAGGINGCYSARIILMCRTRQY